MNKKKFFRPVMLALGVLALQSGRAQVTTPSNSPFFGDYVGCDGGSAFPLEVRHNGNQPIQWWTDSIQRMQLYHTRTGTLPLLGGGSINVQQDGYLGLSGTPGFFATNGYGPFSRLHLADLDPNSEGQNHYNQPWGYRSWMKNGMTLTGNHDHAYIGQRYYGHDSTDLVIHWSDNAEKSPFGPDRLRFIFTTDNTGATQGSRSQEGLEFMRMYPVNQNQGFVGIGDFARPGISPDPEPSERLDILDQTIRIRRLVPDYEDDQLDRLVVTDANGRLHWRDISTIPATADCDWTVLNAGTSGAGVDHSVYTAVGSNDLCPDGTDEIGIGISSPGAKLHVLRNVVTDGTPRTGIFSHMKGDAAQTWHVGLQATAEPASGTGYEFAGVVGDAYNGSNNLIGTRGRAYVNTAMSSAAIHGLRGESNVTNGATVTAAYGVYGDATAVNGTTVTNNYGLYARGYGGTSAFGTYGYAVGLSSTTTAIGAKGYAQDASSTTIGIDGHATATQGTKMGARAVGTGAGLLNYGLNASASNATTNYGVYASASGGTTNYGIYATATGAGWAAFIAGAGWIPGGTWSGSDAALKLNINDLDDAASLLVQLNPKRYQYRTTDYPQLGLPEGTHDGIMADEIQAVRPDLVRTVTHPAEYDSLGNELHAPVTFQAVNYGGLIPVLVAATNEHTEQVTSLQDQIAHLQQQLAAVQQDLASCCAAHGDADQRSMSPGAGAAAGAGEALRTDLHIIPNPVADLTQLRYMVAAPGRTRLEVSDASGKRLEVLEEAVREVGSYTHDWNTTDLAPGTYHCTLYLNDSFVVKKAVKVAR